MFAGTTFTARFNNCKSPYGLRNIPKSANAGGEPTKPPIESAGDRISTPPHERAKYQPVDFCSTVGDIQS